MRLEARGMCELAGLGGPSGCVSGRGTLMRPAQGPWTPGEASLPPSRMASTKVL